ncbi:MAG: NTP transferase domain-containing protein [Planctomycetota bacterium]
MRPVFSALVLAAGDSARMGTSKALLRIAEKPAWLRLVEHCLAVGGEEVLVLVAPGSGLEAPPERAVRIIEVPPAMRSLGPIGSLVHGVNCLAPNRARLVCPVDHPFVRRQTLETLIENVERIRIPCHLGRGGHPVLLPLDVDSELRKLASSNGTLRDLIRSRAPLLDRVEVSDPAVLWNCNSKELFERYIRQFEQMA